MRRRDLSSSSHSVNILIDSRDIQIEDPGFKEVGDHGWTHPVCERCWIDRMGEYVSEDWGPIGRDGKPLRRIVSIRRPVRLRDFAVEIEVCCFCSHPTVFGCYVRMDPEDPEVRCLPPDARMSIVWSESSPTVEH